MNIHKEDTSILPNYLRSRPEPTPDEEWVASEAKMTAQIGGTINSAKLDNRIASMFELPVGIKIKIYSIAYDIETGVLAVDSVVQKYINRPFTAFAHKLDKSLSKIL